jgi:hypothetical protein
MRRSAQEEARHPPGQFSISVNDCTAAVVSKRFQNTVVAATHKRSRESSSARRDRRGD